MIEWLVLAFLTIFLEKLVEIAIPKNKIGFSIYFFVAILLIGFTLFANIVYSSLEKDSYVYLFINNCYDLFMSNTKIHIILLGLILIGIRIVIDISNGKYSFSGYSKRIIRFTDQAEEGSIISIIAGDMSVFGNIYNDEVKSEDNDFCIDTNKEYKQFLSIYEYVSKIRILCNNKLNPEIKSSIIKGTLSVEDFYRQNSVRKDFESLAFQQLLRIGKMRHDFMDKVSFRFYNSDDDDNRLRARFISNGNQNVKGIVYHKEGSRKILVPGVIKIVKDNIKKILSKELSVKKIFAGIIKEDDLYSVNYTDSKQSTYYMDLFRFKWNAYSKEDNQKITDFCQELYEFTTGCEKKNSMALIYVNSYEIARKKQKRKEFPPFGVLYLASVVREQGWFVDVYSIDENNYKRNLKDYDVVGFSIVSSYSYNLLKLCSDTSEMKKDVIKIAGGYQAEKFYKNVFRDFGVRLIFKGEGEDSIKEFIERFKYSNYGTIDGIIYKGNNGEIIPNPGRGCVDINRIPLPARDILDDNDVVMTDRLAGTDIKMVHMLFSRGCPNNCLYCAAYQDGNNKRIRYRAKEKIVEELIDLKQKYSIEGFSIIDDCFLTDKKKALEICNYISSKNLNLKWSLAARIDHIDDEVLDVLYDSGCIEIKFGAETGSDELLKKMNKGITVAQTEEVIKKTKDKGMGVKLFIITGLPGETDDTHKQTIMFLTRMKEYIDRVSLLRYTPLAGSTIYESPEKFGINPSMLSIDHFEKMRLYRKSYNWWKEDRTLSNCEKWYEELRIFIDTNWTEDI